MKAFVRADGDGEPQRLTDSKNRQTSRVLASQREVLAAIRKESCFFTFVLENGLIILAT
jgi:hypothetical protein